MSDNSSSTGSNSSSNSWTMLNPEEAAVESVGPVDDGTESLGDIPSLSEEMIVTMMEAQPVESVLSEEGQQVCQETAPEASEGPVPSSPALLSPSPASHAPLYFDWDSQPPVIHDIVTSSPADHNDQLSAMPFVTNVNLLEPHHGPFTEPEPEEEEDSTPELPALESAHPETTALDAPTDGVPVPSSPAVERPAPSLAEASVPTETITPADVYADSSPAPESEESVSPAPDSLAPETIGSAEPVEAPAVDKEETELPEKMADVGKEEEPTSHFAMGRGDSSSAEDDGLRRRRNMPSYEAPRRTSDEDEEDDEVEFRLAERKEEKQGFSLNKLIVAALVLLCLGSLFFSDDLDSPELSDADQDMNELFDKLQQEDQQISQLEAQLQSQKEELDSALQEGSGKANEQGDGALEKENAKLKEELLSLPGLQQELDTLRARVTELSQLTASPNEPAPPASSSPPPAGQPGTSNQSAAGPERTRGPGEGGRLTEELQRQKALLEESRKRLEGMKKDGGRRKGVREGLSEVQRRLSEQVDRLGQRKPWESQGSKWDTKKGKDNGKDHWKQDEKKSEKDRKGHGKDKHNGDRKSHKHSSHKEAWRKHQDEWDRKKDERKMDREQRKRERTWHSDHHHQHHHQHQPHRDHKPQPQNQHQPPQQHHHHHHHQPHRYDHAGFWEHQGEKLGRNLRKPRTGCGGTEGCAAAEGLYPVELSEFEALLEAYLSKLEGAAPPESREELRRLAARFFEDGVFVHDRALFGDFAGDVADILEDMADVLEDGGQGDDDDALEEAMEEFEREALWKFGVTA